MECLLNLLAVCLFDPSTIHVTAHLETAPQVTKYVFQYERGRGIEFDGEFCRTHWCRGPVAELRLGTTIEVSRAFRIDWGVSMRDRIQESEARTHAFYVDATWTPFAR